MATLTETVEGGYKAFLNGDVPAVMALFDDNIEWDWIGPAEIPLAGKRRGKAELGKFFQVVGANFRPIKYERREFHEGKNHVTVFGWQLLKALSTGKEFETHFVHIWTFKNGKCVRMIELYDTAPFMAALKK